MASNIQSWPETYAKLKMYHDMAYLKIDEALKKEEQNVNEDFGNLPAFHSAAANNHCKKVHNLLQTKTKINSISKDGSTALLIAAREGHLAMVALLLLFKAKVNVPNCHGSTPLFVALLHRNYEVFELLIKNGARIHNTDIKNQNMLLYLIRYDAPPSLVKLIANKIDVNAKNRHTGRNALHFIVKNKFSNSLEWAKCLVESGADLDASDNSNYTALHIATIAGNLQLVEFLIDKGATIDAVTLKLITPLLFAIKFRHFDVADVLMDKGANINLGDAKKLTPLHFLAAKNSSEMAEKAIRLGADMEAKSGWEKATPLHIAVRFGSFNTLQILVSYGAKVNAKTRANFTPFHLGALTGDENIVTYLLANGSFFDEKICGSLNLCAIDIASKLNNVTVVSVLKNVQNFFNALRNKSITDIKKCLKNGAPVNCRSIKYKSGLIYACWKGYSDIVNILLAEGAGVNIADDKNMSALHYASKFGHSTIVSILLNHGAIYNIASKEGKVTPLQFARESKVTEIIDLLEVIDRVFENVEDGKLEVIQEMAEIKNKFPHKFYTITKVVNRDKKKLLEVAFAGRSIEIANSLIKMFH